MGSGSARVTNLGELSNKVYGLLSELETEERSKVITAVMSLFGEEVAAPCGANNSPMGGGASGVVAPQAPAASNSAKQYYAMKQPKNKGEMLAVAAKFREEHSNGASSAQNDFASFFRDARQNFDRGNFFRDIKNAQNQAHLFNKGTPRGQYQLSFYGQQYVDALPDREAVKKLKRPGRKTKTKKSAKSAGSK